MQFSIITSNRQNVIKSLEQTKLQMPPKIVDKKKKHKKIKHVAAVVLRINFASKKTPKKLGIVYASQEDVQSPKS